MSVTETFFTVDVEDMDRATAFYVDALEAKVVFSSSGWTSLYIAGVRVGLAQSSECMAGRVGLHFSVSDLASTGVAVVRAGGTLASPPVEVAPGVVIMQATDTEGNTFTLTGSATSEERA